MRGSSHRLNGAILTLHTRLRGRRERRGGVSCLLGCQGGARGPRLLGRAAKYNKSAKPRRGEDRLSLAAGTRPRLVQVVHVDPRRAVAVERELARARQARARPFLARDHLGHAPFRFGQHFRHPHEKAAPRTRARGVLVHDHSALGAAVRARGAGVRARAAPKIRASRNVKDVGGAAAAGSGSTIALSRTL